MGCCSRSLVAAMHTGLDNLVAFIMEDETASHFYINGYSRLTPGRRLFLVQAGIVSRVSEGVLLQLLKGCQCGTNIWCSVHRSG